MSLKSRVLAVVTIAHRPMSTAQIAHKMRLPTPRVSSEVSKLHMYGHLRLVEKRRLGVALHSFYAPTGKPYDPRPIRSESIA